MNERIWKVILPGITVVLPIGECLQFISFNNICLYSKTTAGLIKPLSNFINRSIIIIVCPDRSNQLDDQRIELVDILILGNHVVYLN